MEINNFAIDHVLRGIMLSTADGSYMWSINQITDPSLNITSETAEAVDALGSKIAVFNRGKSAEFTASNSLFDLGLFAAQNGVDKQIASSSSTIIAPMFDEFERGDVTTYDLKKTPSDPSEITKVYVLNGDGTLGDVIEVGASAGASKFGYDETAQLTFPTDLNKYPKGTRFICIYDYACDNGVAVVGDAINFPKAGRFILEVLGTDVCDPTTQIHAYLDFPNAKLDANVDVSFTTDGNHPFTIQCQQNYCDAKKTLYKLIIPQEV